MGFVFCDFSFLWYWFNPQVQFLNLFTHIFLGVCLRDSAAVVSAGVASSSSPHRTMWLPRLALLLLLRLSGVLQVDALNTCQSINLDAQKSRRIEAVRGQILSKLRIRSPPGEDVAPTPAPVPPEVMLLYNSTRELLKERARLAESACERESSEEDYYAKEVQRIDMMPPRTDTSEFPEGPTCSYKLKGNYATFGNPPPGHVKSVNRVVHNIYHV